MEDPEELNIATLEEQFASFAKMLDWSCPRDTITLYCSDYWMRQSHIIDDRRVTMTDTGIIWNKFSKAELNWDEWHEYLSELCVAKELNKLEVEEALTNCGLPGTTRVSVPQYRDFFDTYKSKKGLVVCESLDSCGKPKKRELLAYSDFDDRLRIRYQSDLPVSKGTFFHPKMSLDTDRMIRI